MKRQKTNFVVAATSLLALGISVPLASAATLVEYNFADGAVQEATTVETGFSGTDFTFTNNGETSFANTSTTDVGGFQNNFFMRANATGSSDTLATSLADSISGGAAQPSLTLTITNSSGTDYTLNDFSFTIGGQTGGSGTWDIRASVFGSTTAAAPVAGNEFMTSSFTSTGSLATAPAAGNPGFVIANGETATFDVQFWTPDGTGTDQIGRFTGVSISGVAVPEPSSAALLGLAGFALITLRRRRI